MNKTPDSKGIALQKNNKMERAIGYYRVSRERQGLSGLGIDAQVKTVRDYAKANNYVLYREYFDVESAKKNHRPEFDKALRQCRKEKITLLIAKLDRMSRRVSFISNLMESGIRFIVLNVPGGEKFTMHILAAVAEKEGDDISERTHMALQVAKAKGTILGKYGRYVLSKKNRELSCQFAEKMKPIVIQLMEKGFKTIRSITKELNRLRIPTYRKGSKWHISYVHKIISLMNKNISICISKQKDSPPSPAAKNETEIS